MNRTNRPENGGPSQSYTGEDGDVESKNDNAEGGGEKKERQFMGVYRSLFDHGGEGGKWQQLKGDRVWS